MSNVTVADLPSSDHPPSIVDNVLPTEVWESIIDETHNARLWTLRNRWRPQNDRTLHACALVCRAWRPRSQRWLFHTVWLEDTVGLYAFSALLDTPHIKASVSSLVLGGPYLHTARSMLPLLPVLLLSKLPNLQKLRIEDYLQTHEEYTRVAVKLYSTELKDFLSFPMAPRMPALIRSTAAGITELYLHSITFPSFGSCVRVLAAFSALRKLTCVGVEYSISGVTPRCLAPWSTGFLPHLDTVWLGLAAPGPARLLPALGSSLKFLGLDLPHCHEKSGIIAEAPTLCHLPALSTLVFVLRMDELQSTQLAAFYNQFRDALRTWAHRGRRMLVLRPIYFNGSTRDQYAGMLRALGPITEDCLDVRVVAARASDAPGPQSTTLTATPCGSETPPRSRPLVSVSLTIADTADRRGWWEAEALGCFPGLVQAGLLVLDYRTINAPLWKDATTVVKPAWGWAAAESARKRGETAEDGDGDGAEIEDGFIVAETYTTYTPSARD